MIQYYTYTVGICLENLLFAHILFRRVRDLDNCLTQSKATAEVGTLYNALQYNNITIEYSI